MADDGSGLAQAWAEAEALLPDDETGIPNFATLTLERTPDGCAYARASDMPDRPDIEAFGHSPEAALRDLAVQLRANH